MVYTYWALQAMSLAYMATSPHHPVRKFRFRLKVELPFFNISLLLLFTSL